MASHFPVVKMRYVDVPVLSFVSSLLETANETYRDRQVVVKLEAYKGHPTTSNSTTPVSSSVPFKRNLRKQLNLSENNIRPTLASSLTVVTERPLDHKRKCSESSENSYCSISSPVSVEVFPHLLSSPTSKKHKQKVKSTTTTEVFQNKALEQSYLQVPTIYRGRHPRKQLLSCLTQTLNSVFVDYDFSKVDSKQFERMKLAQVVTHVNATLLELSLSSLSNFTYDSYPVSFLHDIWVNIANLVSFNSLKQQRQQQKEEEEEPEQDQDQETTLNVDLESLFLGVEVYTYIASKTAEIDADPLSQLGALSTLNYFFCNTVTNSVVFLFVKTRPKQFTQVVAEEKRNVDFELHMF